MIPIFAAEREAGLEHQILSTASVTYASVAELAQPFDLSNKAAARVALGSDLYSAKATNQGQFDLHYLKSLMVSTGWNHNTDVFVPIEVWNARSTPEDKPFNFEHKQDDIIGHITACYVVDKDGKVIAGDTVADKLPEKFHIITPAVLYKVWANEDLQKRMNKILDEIPQGKWFVSMEALFTNFDYGMQKADGSTVIVPRTAETAFLTKHLRQYKGDGKYKDQALGRVLRNITFSGKGLVLKPANPESIILTDDDKVETSNAKFVSVASELGYEFLREVNPPNTESEKTMATENDTKLVADLQAAQAKIQSLETQVRENDTKGLKAKADALDVENKSQAEQLAVLKTENETVKASLTKITAERDEATKALAKIEAERKHEKRVQAVVVKLGKTVEQATAYILPFETLTDENFNTVIDTQAADYEAVKKAAYDANQAAVQDGGNKDAMEKGGIKAGTKPSVKQPIKTITVPAGKPPISPGNVAPGTSPVNTPPGTVAVASDEGEGNADLNALETATAVETATLAGSVTDSGVDNVHKSVASYFGVTVEDK